jgi:acyl-CoA synthetase (AMP-forming)/AMP-acid ligase II
MTLENQTLIHHFLEASANLHPDKIALIHEETRASYAEINNQANHLAHCLLNEGVCHGDRVVVLLENGLEYVISYYAVLKAGAVVVPLSTDLKTDGLRVLLEKLEPKVMVSSFRFEQLLESVKMASSTLQCVILKSPKLHWASEGCMTFSWEDLMGNQSLPNPNIPMDETALASVVYTSGSTGEPLGVMLSHRNIVINTHAICESLRLTDTDVQMVVLPFFYVMGKSLLNTHFAVGGTVVIHNKFAFLASVLNRMVAERVTGFSGVPSTYAYLLHRSPLMSYRDKLDALRYCSQAGGHMPRALKEELRRALPDHTQIYIMYGATEGSARLTCLEAERFETKMDSVGKPISGVTLQVLTPKGEVLPPKQTGEIVAKGNNIMQGYWKNAKATDIVMDQNGYRTGDLGYRDDEGYFFIQGRKDHLLKVGGHRINPQDIEDILMKSDLLIEVAVLGVPDNLQGHKLVALATPKDNIVSENDVLHYCSERLPGHKVPKAVKLINALPKNASGKIDRIRCLELVGKLNSSLKPPENLSQTG